MIPDRYLGQYNAGFTHTDYKKKLTIIGIGKVTSKEEFLNTIAHEAKHAQSHICQYYNIDEDSEDAAYLMGYIIMKMYETFKLYLCNC